MPRKAIEVFTILSVLYAGTFAFMAGHFSLLLIGKGLDQPAIALYFAIYSLAVLLLEVPTGAFADAYGRKKAVAAAFLLQVIFLSGFIMLPNGLMFTAFALIVALADSLMSGSAEAYAVNMLHERGKMDYTHKLLSSARTWGFSLYLAGSLIGGFAGTFSMIYPAAIGLPFAAAGLLYAQLALKDDSPGKDFRASERSILDITIKAVRESGRNPALGAVYLVSLLMGLGSFGLFLYWQVVLSSVAGWDEAAVGSFFALISLVIILGSRASSFLRADWRTCAILMVGLASSLALASWIAAPLAIALLILAWEALWAAYQPIEGAIINGNSPPSIRATVISVRSLSFRAGWVVLGFLVAATGLGDPRALWLAGSAFFLLAAALAAFAALKRFPASAGVKAPEPVPVPHA